MNVFLISLLGSIAGLSLLHTYVIYPWHMRRLAKLPQEWEPLEEFPYTIILMAAHNEEAMIQTKVQSIFRNHYPKSRLTVVVGTDACTDKTNELMLQLCQEYPGLRHRYFPIRIGKPKIINQLYKEYQNEVPKEAILVLTDVDAVLEDHTLAELVLPFSNPWVAGVQANILPSHENFCEFTKDPSPSGNVTAQEIRYMQGEMITKQGESTKGSVIGGYGALMAMRWKRFEPSPDGLLVDDFFWFASLLQKPRTKVVFAEKAIARMPLEGNKAIQFRRKRRLGKGNLQNLWIFKSLIFQRETAYFFVSHKVLRWLSPWLLMAFYVCCTALVTMYWKLHEDYGFVLNWLMFIILLPASIKMLSFPLLKLDVFKGRIRLLEHFISMNLALTLGAFDLFFKSSRHVWWDNRKGS